MYLNRLITVIVLVLASSFLVGRFFDYRYKKRMAYHVFDKMDVILSKGHDYDVLFLGNSRTHSGINPYYVDSITGLDTYNLAIGAAEEQELKLITTLYLQNHKAPAIAIIGLDNSMLIKYNILKERFPYLFYLHNDTIRSYMKNYGFPAGLIRTLPFLKYSFFDEFNRTALFTPGPEITRFDHNIYKGFINIYPNLANEANAVVNQDPMVRTTLPVAKKINDTAAATFLHTIELLQSKGTTVVFLFTPVRFASQQERERWNVFDSFFVSASRTYQLPVIRADSSSMFTPEYFADPWHLNEPGSRLLSKQVGEFIKELVKGRLVD